MLSELGGIAEDSRDVPSFDEEVISSYQKEVYKTESQVTEEAHYECSIACAQRPISIFHCSSMHHGRQ